LDANADIASNDVNGTSKLLSADEEDKYPNKKFFKCGFGFIAWALWGHIPILNSAGMQGDFFCDAKKNASFGRNTKSRAAFRKLLVQKNGAGVDNRRGKKRRAEEEEASTLTPTHFDSSKILAKTLQYMATESLENRRQKVAEMGMRSIRDKLISRHQKEDSIDEEIDRFARVKKKPGQALLDDDKNAIENEIVSLEEKLDEFQSEEYRRHSNVINQRRLELTAFSSEDTTIIRCNSNNESSAGLGYNHPIDVDNEDEEEDVDVNIIVHVNINNKNGCIECDLPSNHSCQKCKWCVCSLCCAGKRELENAWWCDMCFRTQTVANQQSIRDGLYCTNDEEVW
jgi:hypothetical protein